MTAAAPDVVSPLVLPVPDGAPSWVLLDTAGYIAKRHNATFAETLTSNGQPIHCPGLAPADFADVHRVIGAEADLVLFRPALLRLLPLHGAPSPPLARASPAPLPPPLPRQRARPPALQ
ncbi:hypothetical protein ZWY2020_055472 [Hordeum vulgare]|nr:hypothetical protein ZWY2020_055472 [Hordeum vulgare]